MYNLSNAQKHFYGGTRFPNSLNSYDIVGSKLKKKNLKPKEKKYKF